jgi:uncharacterized protein (TIGR02996 family)
VEEHEPFIAAIEEQPDDRTTRLVYADWLGDRDHPAGEYLRTELELAALPEESDRAPELRATLRALRQRIEPEWLARFDQPRVMLANPTPFPAGWWGVELPGVRDCDRVHSRHAFDTLPPLRYPRFAGTFDWLPQTARAPGVDPNQARRNGYLNRIVERSLRCAKRLGLTVPPDYIQWVTDPSIRRPPACFVCGLPDRPGYVDGYCYPDSPDSCPCCLHTSWDGGPVNDPPGSELIFFCSVLSARVNWFLYLTPEGYHAVVAGLIPLYDSAEPLGDLCFVAPSVEAFIYRWWLEGGLRCKLRPRSGEVPTSLTPEEQAYLEFYRRHPVGETRSET